MKEKRLESIDALRGFDMLFITGLAALIISLCNLFPSTLGDWFSVQMTHVEWDGLRHHDTIFPLFLFIAGITFPFSMAKHSGNIYPKIIKRGCILVLLGIIYNGLFSWNFQHLRFASVLGRIGIAWMVAAILFVNFKTKTRIIIAVGTLVAYWLVSALVVAPDAPAGSSPFSPEGCISGYIDRMLLPGRLYGTIFDPEGIFSAIGAVITAMLGMFTGELLRNDSISGNKKSVYMALGGILFFAIGMAWNTIYPINKALWSGSFVMAVGGYSLLMTALFYYIIDVRQWKKWAFFLKVVGMNSITIYMAQEIIDFHSITAFFLGGTAGLLPEDAGQVLMRAGYLATIWLFLYFLYKKNVFLKV